jgi:hypothetical protein
LTDFTKGSSRLENPPRGSRLSGNRAAEGAPTSQRSHGLAGGSESATEANPVALLRPSYQCRRDLWEAHLACYAQRIAEPDLIQLKHRGLNLRQLPDPVRQIFGDYKPEKSLEYYQQFRRTEDPQVLLEFMAKYPLEFEYSGWVLSAFGYVLLGYSHPDKAAAERLWRSYWRRSKHPIRDWDKLYALSVAGEERRKFSTPPHRQCFKVAIGWLSRHIKPGTGFANFKQDHPMACPCINETTFSDLKVAVGKVATWLADKNRPQIAHVLDEYVGIAFGKKGLGGRTQRAWTNRANARPRNKNPRSKRH